MNEGQKWIVGIGTAVGIAMILFPPWEEGPELEQVDVRAVHYGGQEKDLVEVYGPKTGSPLRKPVSRGYAPLWDPPSRNHIMLTEVTVNQGRLFVQLLIVAALTVGLAWLDRNAVGASNAINAATHPAPVVAVPSAGELGREEVAPYWHWIAFAGVGVFACLLFAFVLLPSTKTDKRSIAASKASSPTKTASPSQPHPKITTFEASKYEGGPGRKLILVITYRGHERLDNCQVSLTISYENETVSFPSSGRGVWEPNVVMTVDATRPGAGSIRWVRLSGNASVPEPVELEWVGPVR